MNKTKEEELEIIIDLINGVRLLGQLPFERVVEFLSGLSKEELKTFFVFSKDLVNVLKQIEKEEV